MIRTIVQLGDPVLKTPARLLDSGQVTGEFVQTLVRDMTETLATAKGVGLAAPQVGESVRLILAGSFPTAANLDRPYVPVRAMINPVIVDRSETTQDGWEGCLSFLHFRVRVRRFQAVVVGYFNPDGTSARVEAEGFYARVLQHEIDHLDGILTLDRAEGPEDVRPAD